MMCNANLTSRREFLVSGSTAMALFASGCGLSNKLSIQEIPWGLQLYTLGNELDQDFEVKLIKLGQLGYRKVELAGLLGRSVTEWNSVLSKAGLKATSAHVPSFSMDGMKSLEDNLDELIEQSQALGVSYMVAPLFHIPERLRDMREGEDFGAYLARAGSSMSVDDWKANAEFLNVCGEAVAEAGMHLAYHNHNPEFTRVGDGTGMDILFAETDPDLVFFELDAAWVAAAGYDVAAYFSRFSDRFKLMHVKDIKATYEPNTVFKADLTKVGAGMLPWNDIILAALEAGVTEFFVEQDNNFHHSRMESVAASLQYLQSLSSGASVRDD